MFLIYSTNCILGYIISKNRKPLDLKKISIIVEMPPLKNPRDIN
jgi:hypothetical protein